MRRKLTNRKLIGMGVIVLIVVLALLWLQAKLASIFGQI